MNDRADIVAYSKDDRYSNIERLKAALLLQSTYTYRTNALQFADDYFNLKSGDHVIEVGSGLALTTARFAATVGEQGVAMAIDASDELTKTAERELKSSFPNMIFQQGNIQQLPVNDQQFNACYIEKLLRHLDHPQQALTEVVRVLKTGGKIVLCEPDFTSINISPWDESLGKIWRDYYCQDLKQPNAGARIADWIAQAGFSDIKVQIENVVETSLTRLLQSEVPIFAYLERGVADGKYSQAEAESYREQLVAAENKGSFYFSMNMMTVGGTLD